MRSGSQARGRHHRCRHLPGHPFYALVSQSMDISTVLRVREEMERADARRLQPHFIESFFKRAFSVLGGGLRERESRRYEITHVPLAVRRRDRETGIGDAVGSKYERVTFERDLTSVPGKTPAVLLCPGRPLLDSVISLITERYRDVLRQGVMLVDETDSSSSPRALVALDHEITDGRTSADGTPRVVSRRFEFVELYPDGSAVSGGYAPYLDYRAAH